MNKKWLAIHLAGIACVTSLAGCATNDQGQVVIDTGKVNAVIMGALTPPPVVVEEPVEVYEPGYEPGPYDVYISNVDDRNVVFVGGDTFIWFVGPDGVRHRRFYAHGDRRQEIFHRRADLHDVMAHHGGHLPDHAIEAHGRPGMDRQHAVAGNHAAHPGGPVANHAAAAKKPPAHDDKKKS